MAPQQDTMLLSQDFHCLYSVRMLMNNRRSDYIPIDHLKGNSLVYRRCSYMFDRLPQQSKILNR